MKHLFSPRALRACLVAACLCCVFTVLQVGWRVPHLIGFGLVCLLAVNIRKRRQSGGWTHGTARLASYADLIRSRMLGDEGLILGSARLVGRPSLWAALNGLFLPSVDSEAACRHFFSLFHRCRWATHRFIRLRTYVHLATFAPAGRGKSTCVLIPNLLSYTKSCVVVDPKGELFNATADHRRREFDHRIIRLDPFALYGPGSELFNPLLFIDANAHDFIEQCSDLANMLVVRTGQEHDPYFLNSAESVLTAFIAYVCACEDDPEERTLKMVNDLLSSPKSYAKAVETMQKVTSHGGVIKRQGQEEGRSKFIPIVGGIEDPQQQSFALAHWIHVTSSPTTVPAGSSRDLPFSIEIPSGFPGGAPATRRSQ